MLEVFSMIKKSLLVILVLFCTFFVSSPVFAENYSGEVVYKLDDSGELDCDTLFGDPGTEGTVAHFLEQILNIMMYAGPILCLVLSISDFVKAAASQDKDALTKAGKTTGKRIMFAMILFFIPVLVDFLFPLLGWYGTCGIGT